jgi:hypothetical protein
MASGEEGSFDAIYMMAVIGESPEPERSWSTCG